MKSFNIRHIQYDGFPAGYFGKFHFQLDLYERTTVRCDAYPNTSILADQFSEPPITYPQKQPDYSWIHRKPTPPFVHNVFIEVGYPSDRSHRKNRANAREARILSAVRHLIRPLRRSSNGPICFTIKPYHDPYGGEDHRSWCSDGAAPAEIHTKWCKVDVRFVPKCSSGCKNASTTSHCTHLTAGSISLKMLTFIHSTSVWENMSSMLLFFLEDPGRSSGLPEDGMIMSWHPTAHP